MPLDLKSSTAASDSVRGVVGMVGVLGGMGPLATVDFMQKLIAATPAEFSTRDQDHVPVVVSSIPQIPDRLLAFRGEGTSPLAAMVSSGRRLIQAGAELIVMPCNTAHLWFAELQAALQVPMLHMVDAALDDSIHAASPDMSLGLLCTEASLQSGLYQARAAKSSRHKRLRWTVPTQTEMTSLVTPGIQAVKLGQLAQARELLMALALQRRGAQSLLLACTEIRLALVGAERQFKVAVIDATASLAKQVSAKKERPARTNASCQRLLMPALEAANSLRYSPGVSPLRAL